MQFSSRLLHSIAAVSVTDCGRSHDPYRHPWLSAILIPTRRAEDLFAAWWHMIHALGVVPRTFVWDGEGAIGRCRSGKVELTGDCQAFRGVLGANPGHSAPNAAARHRYPTRRPSTRQLCPAALV